MTRILLVDDDAQLRKALAINLAARGHEVTTATDGEHALAQLAEGLPDVVLLDLGLPDLDGLDVLRRLRSWSGVPVVVLTARTATTDVVGALDAGADDFIAKPFGVEEMLARVRAVLRRGTPPTETAIVNLTRVSIDLALRAVTERATGEAVHLTPTEWNLLLELVASPGRLVGQRQLLQAVWGPGYETETHYLRLYLGQLRRKLEVTPARPQHLITEPGVGYRFIP